MDFSNKFYPVNSRCDISDFYCGIHNAGLLRTQFYGMMINVLKEAPKFFEIR
ncbi:hypothetical protein [Anaerotignum sp. MSJ-24]|uniref:hypothetical protein n=1 Tax=Anaerotignum sp. MSJ-24 TaxID=2841521 RepID=UPI001C10EF01|nr:hypothetical protein [Anaerotignum sp. MSJ-24]